MSERDELIAALAANGELAKRAEDAEAALRELVRLKDEKSARSQPRGVLLTDAHHQYHEEKEAAWDAARRVLDRAGET